MKSLTLVVLLFLSLATLAQEQPSENNAQDETESRVTDTVSRPTPEQEREQEGSLQRRVVPAERSGGRNFTPTEKISADNSVPFPVDI